MSEAMTPSVKIITPGQIDKTVDTLTAAFRAELRAKSANYDSDAVQIVLGQSDLATTLVATFTERVMLAQRLASLVKNKHGHYTFDIIGLDLTGEAEVARLTSSGYRVGEHAKSCLINAKEDGYNAKHRLVHGESCKIALIFGYQIEEDDDRTTEALLDLAAAFGYQKPKAGVIPRIREIFSDELMKELNIPYIVALHDTIEDFEKDPSVLITDHSDGGQLLGSIWEDPDDDWAHSPAFAFIVPTNASV